MYDAWGNHAVLDANGNDLTDTSHIGNRNPFRYRGYFYDVETGLYYLQYKSLCTKGRRAGSKCVHDYSSAHGNA